MEWVRLFLGRWPENINNGPGGITNFQACLHRHGERDAEQHPDRPEKLTPKDQRYDNNEGRNAQPLTHKSRLYHVGNSDIDDGNHCHPGTKQNKTQMHSRDARVIRQC